MSCSFLFIAQINIRIGPVDCILRSEFRFNSISIHLIFLILSISQNFSLLLNNSQSRLEIISNKSELTATSSQQLMGIEFGNQKESFQLQTHLKFSTIGISNSCSYDCLLVILYSPSWHRHIFKSGEMALDQNLSRSSMRYQVKTCSKDTGNIHFAREF